MSKTIVEKVSELFRPQAPLWACELTTRHVIVAGVDRKRKRVEGKATVELPAGTVAGSLSAGNVPSQEHIRPYIQQALKKAAFKGSEIGVVIPDQAVRISFLVAEQLPTDPVEHQAFIRWKLKKTVPFDIDEAQVAFQVLGPHRTNGSKASHDVLIALSPRSVIREYEGLLETMELDAGFIVPSTLAALNLMGSAIQPASDVLFLKIAPESITTAVFQDRRLQFYRRVASEPLYDAVYPTVLYYQDKLGGKAIERMVFCGYDEDTMAPLGELQQKLGVPAHRLGPRNIEDIFKPALGAVHFSWASST